LNPVAAIVVTYNRKDLLRRNLSCLLAQEGAACDIFVMDNASTDGTEQMVREDFDLPSVKYVNTGANLGGAGGFEVGVEHAVALGYEYVWIMDDDTLPYPTALAELLKAREIVGDDWGFLSSVAYWTDGSICRMNIQKKNIFKHVGKRVYGRDVEPIIMGSFVSLLVPSKVVLDVGLPIGEYFVWTDDYEFTGRISSRYPCYMVPSSKVVHAMKTHTRVNLATDSAERINRYHYIYRNDVHCYRRYGLAGWLYLLGKDAYTAANVVMNSNGNRLWKIRTVFDGFRDGLSFAPKIPRVNDFKTEE